MIHREPILSSLAAGPTPQATGAGDTRMADSDSFSSAKRASTRQRKTAQWPESDVQEVPSTVPVQDSGDRQQQPRASAVRMQTLGQYVTAVLVERSDCIIRTHFFWSSARGPGLGKKKYIWR